MKIENFIHSVELSLNNFCGLQCVGCGSLNRKSSHANYLDFSRVLPVIQELAIKEFVLCGNDGEPLEHPEISFILQKLVDHFPDASIHVSTNGESAVDHLSGEFIRQIGKRVHFQVAVDGHDEKIHRLTRRGGNLERVFSSIQHLLYHGASVSLIYSRHEGNEQEAVKTHELMMKKFNLPVFFRDTTHISEMIRPPHKMSRNGNVSVLYGPAPEERLGYQPHMKNLYIEHNGECYPCVSFCKHKTSLSPVNIYHFQQALPFLKEYLKFQTSFCQRYQKEGDIRQCVVNCGIYRTTFRYDTIEDLKAL